MRPICLVLAFSIVLSGCQIQRPGEIAPQRIPGCAAAYAFGRDEPIENLTEQQLAALTYCRTAEAAEAARATEKHADFLADMTLLGIVINVAGAIGLILASQSAE